MAGFSSSISLAAMKAHMLAVEVNILLVDDQPGKLATYEAILSGLDAKLVKASSVDEALQQLVNTDFAVALINVCSPLIDGFELAALIRRQPHCQKTAVILVSEMQRTHLDQIKGFESGAVDYISVPVVPELLRARVLVFLDLYRKTTALEQINRELEQRVTDRTAELMRDLADRKQLQDALLEADQRKDEFLAVLAHELRNPLAPIRAALEVMRLKPMEDPVVTECRDVIDRQIGQLTRLVDDLLDVSRITRGKIRLDRQPTDVATIVQLAVEMQRPALEQRRQQLVIDIPAGPLTVNGDLTRLAESLSNLLNNAAKYTDVGGRIVVQAREFKGVRSDGGSTVAIRVRDNGAGIPTEMLSKVFDLFTQVGPNLHRSQGGLGIGLALVRKLVEMHGGHVDGYSEGIGKGSEFVIRLPLVKEQAQPPPSDDALPLTPACRRVLVADDNRDAVAMVSLMLRMIGVEVEAAYDGPQAIRAAERYRPDLALIDIGMPDLSGLEVARVIRAQPWGRELLLVALTGWGQDSDQRRTREAGFDEHVTKPINRAQLLRLMATIKPRASAEVPS